jgi:prepilin-type N-terminal cleavage/methylation domain-containing protein
MKVSEAITRVRRRVSTQEGVTLVELMVAMAILSIAMVAFLSTLTTVQKGVAGEGVRSETINQVRLAMQSIDRQVRSGNLLYNPNVETPANFTLRVYTQANLPTTGEAHCALWTINSQNQLVYRWWPQQRPEEATPWQVIADGVVNRVSSPAVSAFTLDPTGRTVTATFLVNTNLTIAPNATERLQTSVTGRNTSFGYPIDVCEDLPT